MISHLPQAWNTKGMDDPGMDDPIPSIEDPQSYSTADVETAHSQPHDPSIKARASSLMQMRSPCATASPCAMSYTAPPVLKPNPNPYSYLPDAQIQPLPTPMYTTDHSSSDMFPEPPTASNSLQQSIQRYARAPIAPMFSNANAPIPGPTNPPQVPRPATANAANSHPEPHDHVPSYTILALTSPLQTPPPVVANAANFQREPEPEPEPQPAPLVLDVSRLPSPAFWQFAYYADVSAQLRRLGLVHPLVGPLLDPRLAIGGWVSRELNNRCTVLGDARDSLSVKVLPPKIVEKGKWRGVIYVGGKLTDWRLELTAMFVEGGNQKKCGKTVDIPDSYLWTIWKGVDDWAPGQTIWAPEQVVVVKEKMAAGK